MVAQAQACSGDMERKRKKSFCNNQSMVSVLESGTSNNECLQDFSFIKDGLHVHKFNSWHRLDDEDRNDMLLELVEAIDAKRLESESIRETYNLYKAKRALR